MMFIVKKTMWAGGAVHYLTLHYHIETKFYFEWGLLDDAIPIGQYQEEMYNITEKIKMQYRGDLIEKINIKNK